VRTNYTQARSNPRLQPRSARFSLAFPGFVPVVEDLLTFTQEIGHTE
jgi:hypothetical protein